jgi:RND superfamily putative drug exporter
VLVPGTKSAQAADVESGRFGERNAVVVLLQAPKDRLGAEGRALTRRLQAVDHVTVAGPWSGLRSRVVRPRDDRALLIVSIARPFEEASEEIVPQLRAALRSRPQAGVRVSMTGFSDISHAIKHETVQAVERAELIAAPLIVVVLLLVLGSPLAALVPLTMGGMIVAASTGVLDLVNRATELDAIALNLASMMGLALGVDYALLMLTRYREERSAGRGVEEAAQVAITTAGRTVRFAGAILALAMVTALFVTPGSILLSSCVGVITAVVLSLLGSVTVLPATLVLSDRHLDRWRFSRGAAASTGWGDRALRLVRRPAVAGGAVAALLLAIIAPALTMETGPPDPRTLPADAPARQDFQTIRDAVGGGWVTPLQIVVATDEGTLAAPARLDALASFERQLARDPLVAAVIGTAPIAERTGDLTSVPAALLRGRRALAAGVRDLAAVDGRLAEAAAGVGELRAGLGEASRGASRLGDGAQATKPGVERLDDGAAALAELPKGILRATAALRRLRSGLREAESGASRVAQGSARLADGLAAAVRGFEPLPGGLREAADGLGKIREPADLAREQAAIATKALEDMVLGRTDPNYRRARTAATTAREALNQGGGDGRNLGEGLGLVGGGLASAAGEADRGLRGLHTALRRARQLEDGTRRLRSATGELVDGIERLTSEAGDLTAGARALERAAGSLRKGTGQLDVASSTLAAQGGRLGRGLESAVRRTAPLQRGLERLRRGVAEAREQTAATGQRFGDPSRLDPILSSGHAALGAIATAPARDRSAASLVLNTSRGGNAAIISVIGRSGEEPTLAGEPVRRMVDDRAVAFARTSGLDVAVGGPAATLQDFDQAVADRLWLYIGLVSLLTVLVLVLVLRSIVMPLIAVALNLLTVGAAFGVLAVLFNGDPAPLGGPGFVDDLMVAAICTVVFALSIDYEVFLLARVREGYERTGTTDGAIAYALRHTAGVITGAAGIMTGVFVAFALSPLISVRELGVGLTVAVILDATVVRLILLPACLRLAGRWNWWLPRIVR